MQSDSPIRKDVLYVPTARHTVIVPARKMKFFSSGLWIFPYRAIPGGRACSHAGRRKREGKRMALSGIRQGQPKGSAGARMMAPANPAAESQRRDHGEITT